MFTVDEIDEVVKSADFRQDYDAVKQLLASCRVQQRHLFEQTAPRRLLHFVDAILASVSSWAPESRIGLCQLGAEVAESLAIIYGDDELSENLRFDSAVLYELGAMPALAISVMKSKDYGGIIGGFFRRGDELRTQARVGERVNSIDASVLGLGGIACRDDIDDYLEFLSEVETPGEGGASAAASVLATRWSLGMLASELDAFDIVIKHRKSLATRANIPADLNSQLRSTGFPLELLPAQQKAIQQGLLDSTYDSWGFAAPTGSGKTLLSRVLIFHTLSANADAKCLYIVPSRALVSEVSTDLAEALAPMGASVTAVSAQITHLDDDEEAAVADSAVVVLTPEKADLLLRLEAAFLDQVELVVVDEAHHIESGTRGALLEMYLWRLRRVLAGNVRFVFLSAVAPNISEIASWLGKRPRAVVVNSRPTRMRAGVYRLQGKGVKSRGVIEYVDGTQVEVVHERAETQQQTGIIQLAAFLRNAGPVLVVAKGKKECENLATKAREWLRAKESLGAMSHEDIESDSYLAVDAHLEREMYKDVPLRKLLQSRIAYHHAGLPPSVRRGVESLIRAGMIDYVFATTTLAEGVNFPFSSVIVQSLALKEPPEKDRPVRYTPVTPRTFWNIAGRAGRPGFDGEGQVVLFEPSLGLERVNAVLDPYLDSSMDSLGPVGSAFAAAIDEVSAAINSGEYSLEELEHTSIPTKVTKRVRGALNLMRVGIVHARATGIVKSPEEIIDGSFARTFLSTERLHTARQLIRSQADVLDEYLRGDDAPPINMVAELGLSLDTLGELRDYTRQMEDWQIEALGKLFFGGTVNLTQVPYVVGPVAKRMSELEGGRLGGFLSDIIVSWISGVPFATINREAKFGKRLEDLISVIYSRVQYLLPWGLYAFDALLELESGLRSINYNGDVRKLAHLADAGVPTFAAYRLVDLDIERVDATRIGQMYESAGGLDTGLDVVAWLLDAPYRDIKKAVRGREGRRVAHRFRESLDALRVNSA